MQKKQLLKKTDQVLPRITSPLKCKDEESSNRSRRTSSTSCASSRTSDLVPTSTTNPRNSADRVIGYRLSCSEKRVVQVVTDSGEKATLRTSERRRKKSFKILDSEESSEKSSK